jgi:hypothetical protein
MKKTLRLAVLFPALLVAQVVVARQPDVAPPASPQAQLSLTEQIELPRLVDIAAQRLKVNIEYDASGLKGTVTLRLGAGVTDEELWELTNKLLAARGFTTVRQPGKNGVLSVVPGPKAPP